MKRNTALYHIVNFGKKEEKDLLAAGKRHEAYQIEHARDTLLYFFDKNPIKNLLPQLDKMTLFTVADNDVKHYDAFYFVFDDATRSLLVELKNRLLEEPK